MRSESEPTGPSDPPSSPIHLGKDELNLAEFPIALVTDRVPAGQQTIKFEDQVYDDRKGQLVTRRLTITASEEYGLPTAKDDEVILGLIQLTKQANNFTDRRVNFTRLDLIRLLRWEDKGQNYERIARSLCRWAGVFLHYENAWWDRQRQSWSTIGFHIIESFKISDGRQIRGQSEPSSRFTWNEEVFRSFQAGYLKRLDLDLYLKLKHPTAKRMYRFLDKRFFHRDRWEFDLKEFALDHIGLSRTYEGNTQLARKLRPAIEELEAQGFLEPLDSQERFHKVTPKRWRVTFIQKAGPPVTPGPQVILLPWVGELTARGITEATAIAITADHPPERIRAKIEVFDWLTARKDKRVSRNPGGYLAESIRKDYAVPKGFEPEAERMKRLQAEAEQGRRAEEARQGAESEHRAREETQQARIDAYWASLTPADQEALQTRALAGPSPFLSLYRQHQGRGTSAERLYLKLIIEAHIVALLGDPGADSGHG